MTPSWLANTIKSLPDRAGIAMLMARIKAEQAVAAGTPTREEITDDKPETDD